MARSRTAFRSEIDGIYFSLQPIKVKAVQPIGQLRLLLYPYTEQWFMVGRLRSADTALIRTCYTHPGYTDLVDLLMTRSSLSRLSTDEAWAACSRPESYWSLKAD